MRYLEWGLLAIGLTFLALFLAFRVDAVIASRSALRTFAGIDGSRSAAAAAHGLTAQANADFSLWSPERITAYQQSLAASGSPIAVMTIRRLGLEVPVFEGTDDLTLNRGAGRILGTAEPGGPGNMGLAAHRDGFFRGLKDVLLGDGVVLAIPGRAIPYVVDEIEIVSPEDVRVLQPRAHPALTLVTCYPFYFIGSAPQRFIVHASIGDAKPSDRQASTAFEFTRPNKKEAAH